MYLFDKCFVLSFAFITHMFGVENFKNHTHHYGKKISVHIVPYRIMKRRESYPE